MRQNSEIRQITEDPVQANQITEKSKIKDKLARLKLLKKLKNLLTIILVVASSSKMTTELTTVDEVLKFEGLRLYASLANLPLSEKLLDHFLHGQGETYDIADDFLSALRLRHNSLTGTNEDSPISDSELIKSFVAEHLSPKSSASRPAIYAQAINETENPEYLQASELENFVGQNIKIFTVVHDTASSDLGAGLGHFTVIVEGKLQEIDYDEQKITFAGPTVVTIKDFYNWDKRNDALYVALDLARSVDLVAPSLSADWMSGIKLATVRDRDGRKLQETGQAQAFNVRANYEILDSMSFQFTEFAVQ